MRVTQKLCWKGDKGAVLTPKELAQELATLWIAMEKANSTRYDGEYVSLVQDCRKADDARHEIGCAIATFVGRMKGYCETEYAEARDVRGAE